MQKIKEYILQTIKYLPLKYAFSRFYGGNGTILFMHKVVKYKPNKMRIKLMEANEVQIGFLEKLIIYLKKKYDIISLDEMVERLNSNKKGRKFLVITFDDGYKDNLLLAYPIFKKLQIPFTIYITNCFPNQTGKLWWYMLEDIIIENKTISIVIKDKKYEFKCLTESEKNTSFLSIREILINASKEGLDSILSQLESNYSKVLSEYVNKEALNWDEIKQLSLDPLVTIGCHTMNHLALNTLLDDEIKNEVIKSKEEIEKKIGIKVKHFAYPFGTNKEINSREVRLVNKFNCFETSTTARTGNIFSEHNDFKNILPRIQIIGNKQDFLIIDLYLSGLIPALINNFKRIVTI